MSNEKDFNPIVAAMCRDMYRYDANEIVQQTEGDSNGGDNQGQHGSKG